MSKAITTKPTAAKPQTPKPQTGSGMALREWLRAKGWTQERLGLAVGVSQVSVNRWCDGEMPGPIHLRAIVALTNGAVNVNSFRSTERKPPRRAQEAEPGATPK